MEERYIAAIDLGTSKLGVCVASIRNQNVQIIYYKESPSAGIRNSCVTVPGKVLGKVRDAISDAQNALKITIHQVVVGLPRWQVVQETASAITDRDDCSKFISESEVRTLKSDALKSYPLKDSKKDTIYGAVAQSYSTEDCVNEPESEIIGMSAEKLEGNFKVFIGSRTYSTNIDKLFASMGIGIARKFFIPGITAKAILKAEEMENGVALIDIGAGVSSVTIFKDNLMRYYAAIPFGGDSITKDIESVCGFTNNMAENIKKAYGACMPDKLSTLGDKVIQIKNEDGKPFKRLSVKVLSEIINARMEEIVNALLYKIQESGLSSEDYLKRGLVVTGGGAELLNCINLFKELSGYSVKLGLPNRYVDCKDCPEASASSASTAIGMILTLKGDRSVNCIEYYMPEKQPQEPSVTPSEPEDTKKPAPDFRPEEPSSPADSPVDEVGGNSTETTDTEKAEPAENPDSSVDNEPHDTSPEKEKEPEPNGNGKKKEKQTFFWKKVVEKVVDSIMDETKEEI